MKVKLKAPFYDRTGLHKKNDVVEIETAAFNPYTMVEIPEVKKKVAPVEEAPVEEVATVEKVEEEAKTPVKKTRKKKV